MAMECFKSCNSGPFSAPDGSYISLHACSYMPCIYMFLSANQLQVPPLSFYYLPLSVSDMCASMHISYTF